MALAVGTTHGRSILRIAAAGIGMFGLGLQFWLGVRHQHGPDLIQATINFFSTFTVLTNALAVCAMLAPQVAPRTGVGRLFSRPSARTICTGYMLVTGAVYLLFLREGRGRETWDVFADQMLHYVTPVLFATDWLVFVRKGGVPPAMIGASLVLPIGYGIWTLLHGAVTKWYPYPFLDVTQLGLVRVLANLGALLALFAAVALALVIADRKIERWTGTHRI